MPAQPTYITRNRHGTFYFRIVVPSPLRSALGFQREIRRTLKTDSQRLALRRARQFAARYEAAFDKALRVLSNDERTEEEILSAIDEIERAGKPQTWGAWASEPTEESPPAKSTLPESYWRNLDEQQRWDAIAALLNGHPSRGIQDHQRETAERLFNKGRAWPFVQFNRQLPRMLLGLEASTASTPGDVSPDLSSAQL